MMPMLRDFSCDAIRIVRASLVALPIFLVACSGTDAVGDAGGPAAPDGGAVSPEFAAVQEIFASSCVRCHDPANPTPLEAVAYPAMDLTERGAYRALVNKSAKSTCGGVLVTPGSPGASYLYAKITQDKPCSGARMPNQGNLPTPPLPVEQIATIKLWIRDGAKP
jgi:hypothetical protein